MSFFDNPTEEIFQRGVSFIALGIFYFFAPRGGNPASAPNNQRPNWVSSPNAGNTAWEKKVWELLETRGGPIADVLHAFYDVVFK